MTNEKKNSLLMIAPFPPPITGQSFASNFLYEKIKNKFDIKIINYTRKDAIKKSKLNFDFISKVIKIGSEIRLLAKKSDIIYFTVSQSLLGNIKDLFFLFKIGKFNRKKTIIHLHGGYFDQYLKNSPLLIKLLNKYFFKNIKAGIVLGDSLKKCFLPILPENRIFVVHNFYQREYQITEEKFNSKWKNPEKINLLFLSNLMIEKGYLDLLDAFIALPQQIKDRLQLNFAGEFENEQNKSLFSDKIKNCNNIKYFGTVTGYQKKEVLHNSHCFILPTYVSFGEGQPISIIESYASGLVVFSTNHGGIRDIFKDGVNGIEIDKKSPESIKNAIITFVENFLLYKNIAENNLIYSKEYDEDKFVNGIVNTFLS
ncbi:MAG TPA: glycosyltransferase family 4 protein [Spirochaetota bacterium]|nr:glycosyltransferase family 4 protein [Spirochaetota bacterium]